VRVFEGFAIRDSGFGMCGMSYELLLFKFKYRHIRNNIGQDSLNSSSLKGWIFAKQKDGVVYHLPNQQPTCSMFTNKKTTPNKWSGLVWWENLSCL